ncbi:hypothetical protein ALPO108162_07230 [Alicyclobacillus pomorum]
MHRRSVVSISQPHVRYMSSGKSDNQRGGRVSKTRAVEGIAFMNVTSCRRRFRLLSRVLADKAYQNRENLRYSARNVAFT